MKTNSTSAEVIEKGGKRELQGEWGAVRPLARKEQLIGGPAPGDQKRSKENERVRSHQLRVHLATNIAQCRLRKETRARRKRMCGRWNLRIGALHPNRKAGIELMYSSRIGEKCCELEPHDEQEYLPNQVVISAWRAVHGTIPRGQHKAGHGIEFQKIKKKEAVVRLRVDPNLPKHISTRA